MRLVDIDKLIKCYMNHGLKSMEGETFISASDIMRITLEVETIQPRRLGASDIPKLEKNDVVWIEEIHWKLPYPVSVDSIEDGVVNMTNSESFECSEYGKTWVLWTLNPEF